jgi:hypothetical protein
MFLKYFTVSCRDSFALMMCSKSRFESTRLGPSFVCWVLKPMFVVPGATLVDMHPNVQSAVPTTIVAMLYRKICILFALTITPIASA